MKLVHWIAVFVLMGVLGWYFLFGSAKPLAPDGSEASSNQETLLNKATPKPKETTAPATSTPAPALPPPQPVLAQIPLTEIAPSKPMVTVYSADPAGILRDGAGNLARLSQAGAVKHCEELGMHLPTIRELVRWKGMLIEKTEAREAPNGLTKEAIDAMNPDGKKDQFFNVYNAGAGYKNHKGEEGNNWFNSSSASAKTGEKYSYNDDTSYVSVGEIPDEEDPYRYSATRCVPGKAESRH